jgi:hypothetical protein
VLTQGASSGALRVTIPLSPTKIIGWATTFIAFAMPVRPMAAVQARRSLSLSLRLRCF